MLQVLEEYLESSERGSKAAEVSLYLTYLTCLIRVMYVGAMKFEEAAAIELANTATLDTRRSSLDARRQHRRQHRDARSPTSRRSTLDARRSTLYANIETLARQHCDARRSTIETSNILITMRKEKTNQLAKNQEVILPKPDTGDGQEMDVTVHLNRYVT